MCTVTYVPCGNCIFLTSNRDERTTRARALLPKRFDLSEGGHLVYPTDGHAGGTWVALKNDSDAGVLMNGAFVAHRPQPAYRKSRGLIFLEIMQGTTPVHQFGGMELAGIEPFTLLLYVNNRLHECRWNGAEKFSVELDAGRPQIWSSATLYDAAAQQQRQAWFQEFLSLHPTPSQADILHFHRTAGVDNPHIDVCMNRDGYVRTVSITSINLSPCEGALSYFDLQPEAATRQTRVHV